MGDNTNLGNNSSRPRINVWDILAVSGFFAVSALISLSWQVQPVLESIPLLNTIPVSILVTASLFGFIVLYALGFSVKKFGGLSFTSPTIIFGLFPLSLFWFVFNAFLPLGVPSQSIQPVLQNAIALLLGAEAFNFLWMLTLTTFETLLIGFLLSIFISVDVKRFGAPQTATTWFAVLIISGFASLIHVAASLALQEAGIVEVGIALFSQWLAFIFFAIVFLIFGMGAALSFHWGKNLIALQLSPVFWILTFVITLVLALLGGRSIKDVTKEVSSLSMFKTGRTGT